MSYFMERVQGCSVNVFRLSPQNSTTATANQQIRFNLPSNALLNTRSLMLMFNATTAGNAARLPANIASLIDRVEVLAGGVQISQGHNLTNVFLKAKEILEGPKCDATLAHPEIVRTVTYVDKQRYTGVQPETYSSANGQTQFAVTNFDGFLGTVEPGVLATDLLPSLTVVFTLAGNEVLSSSAGVDLKGTGGSNDFTDAPGTANATFTLSNIRLNCEVIGLASQVYDAVLAKRIQDVGWLELPFRQAQSFIDSHTGSTKFSVSCQSLDKIWAVYRAAGYETQGPPLVVDGYKVGGAFASSDSGTFATPTDIGKPEYDVGGILDTNSEKYIGKYFNFSRPTTGGTVSFQLQLNGAFFPQFQANTEEMYAISMNSVDRSYNPKMSLNQYITNHFVQCWRTSLPGGSTRVLSGVDSRGLNLQGALNTTGITSGTNLVIFAEMTSSLRVGSNRSLECIL